MQSFIVLYWDKASLPADPPEGFACQADNVRHAERLIEIEHPDSDIAYVVPTGDFEEAYRGYFGDVVSSGYDSSEHTLH